ncbi:phage tail protein [Pedobacter sp. MR22-3]|uniref:phage tail protein n=1 Tax=Pedobacter TaxID=84567 RepID=UPI002245BFF3|nr:tail fiber protein [Pedobacter sp. MR22-3]MCX2583532.1 tail fiber protein [Pedobacter sp. MR22-3]
MEGTIAEVRIFAGNFAPKGWTLCQGQLLNLSTNQALFALVGTLYGGDGQTTFGLPDLRSRTVIGAGAGAGLSTYIEGEKVGVETVSLTLNQIPAHTHTATITSGTGNGTGDATFYASPSAGSQSSGQNAFISEDGSGTVKTYTPSGTLSALNSKSVEVTNVNIPNPGVAIQAAGAGAGHNNIMPSIALNYIICLQGLFPSRN